MRQGSPTVYRVLTVALSCALLLPLLLSTPAQASESTSQNLEMLLETNTEPASVAEETDRFIVTFKQADQQLKQSVIQETEQETAELENVELAKDSLAEDPKTTVIKNDKLLDKQGQEKVIKALEADSRVAAVEPDYIVNAISATPTSEPSYPRLWALAAAYVNAPGAWSRGVNGSGQTIGLVDTGYSLHPDLNNPVSQYDFVSEAALARDGDGRDSWALDPGTENTNSNWHGTFIHGQLAAKVNDIGITGLAYGANVTHARALGRYGNGYVSDITDAIIWSAGGSVAGVPANPKPATVINASLAYPSASCSYAMSQAINFAHQRKIPVVVAAGNSGMDAAGFEPANCSGALVVGAATAWNSLASYSNFGSHLDLLAPGGTVGNDIYSSTNTGFAAVGLASYGTKNGTSMAAPYVSATVALMRQANPALTVEQIRQILTSTAKNTNGQRHLDAAAAVKGAQTYLLKPGSAIAKAYEASGSASRYGAAITGEFSLKDSGVGQQFSKQYTFYWQPRYGAYPVMFTGSIGSKYRDGGYEWGYGYPWMFETAITGGAMQKFAHASGGTTAFYWSRSLNRTHTVGERGAIGSRFTQQGGTATFGFPIEDRQSTGVDGGYRQIFSLGGRQSQFYWSAATGAKIVKGNSAIFHAWQRSGALQTVGYPASDEQDAGAGGVVQFFQNSKGAKTVYSWHPSTGAVSLNAGGGIYHFWRNNGYTQQLGYPLTGEIQQADGSRTVKFTGGSTLRWKPNGSVTKEG